MTLQVPEKRRFYYLDSARGVAALSVITWHFLGAYFNPLQPGFVTSSPLHFFWYGEADVVFFFIHSGFILAYSYTGQAKPLTISSYIRFLIERVFRIYPLFLVILLVSFALKSTVYPLTSGMYTSKHLQGFWTRDYNLISVLKEAILCVPIPRWGNLRLITQDWTLTVEIVVGAWVPILGFLIRKNRWVYSGVIFIAIVALHLSIYLFEFASGVFIFHYWRLIREYWEKLKPFWKGGIVVLAILFYTCFFHFSSLFNYNKVLVRPGVDRFVVILGCSLFFCIIISSKSLQRIMNWPVLVHIGRICYSLYLVHGFLLICFADYLMLQLHHWFQLPEIGYLLIAYFLFLLVTLLISLGSYRWVEKPLNSVGKRISQKVGVLMGNWKTRYHFLDSRYYS